MIAASTEPERDAERILGLLAGHAGLDTAALAPFTRSLVDLDAARHVFAIAAGLESLVLGEPEVLGQVKVAEAHARGAGLVGPELDRLTQAAYRAAKRVRTETAIGERPVSLAAAALEIARRIHGDLATCAGLLIGAGEAGELVARALGEGGLGRLAVSHPSEARIAAAAQRLGANLAPFDRLDDALAAADIVISVLGGGRTILTRAAFERALRARRRRPIFVLDLAAPPDVEPDAERIEDVFVFRLDDLERVAEQGRAGRRGASSAAWAIIDQCVLAFSRETAEREAVPAVVALRGLFEAERERLLDEQPALDAAGATRLLVQRLLHAPSTALRRMAGAGENVAAAEAMLRRLFGVPGARRDEDP